MHGDGDGDDGNGDGDGGGEIGLRLQGIQPFGYILDQAEACTDI